MQAERFIRAATWFFVSCAAFARVTYAEPSSTAPVAQASDEGPNELRLEAARRALRAGAFDDVVANAEAVLAVEPTSSRALALMGVAHQRAGRPLEAQRAFEAALRHAPDDQVARLTYDLGAALAARGRFEEAERAFLRAAGDDHGTLAVLCLIGAAEAALERGEPDSALSHIARARLADVDEEATDILDSMEAEARAAAYDGHARAARRAVDQGDCGLASREYRAALSVEGSAELEERIDLWYGLGLALYLCDRPEEALVALEDLIEHAPADASALFLLGRAATAAKRYERAEGAFEAAIAAGLPEHLDAQARRRLVQLRALRRDLEHAAYAGLTIELGYDDNPQQSGVSGNDSLSLGASDEGSLFAAAQVAAGVRVPDPSRFGAGLAYALEQRVYLAEGARDLSLQLHRLRADASHRAKNVTTSLAGTFELMALGLSGYELVSAYGGAQASVRVRHSDAASSELGARGGANEAIASVYDYLSGPVWDAWLTEDLSGRALSAGITVGYGEAHLGTTRISVDTKTPGCGNMCTSDVFVVPFAYRAARLGANLHWASTRRPIELRLLAMAEGRFYLFENYVITSAGDVPAESFEARRDLRLDGGIELGVPLRHWARFGLRYLITGQLSNVNGTSEWDYDDQQFVRQQGSAFLELRL